MPARRHEPPTAARVAALDILRAVHEGRLADRAFERAATPLEPRDRAWTQELVYGTLRLRARLEHLLSAHTRRPVDAIDAALLDILRLGAYQLTEMGGVPAYAAVSQSVELAKHACGRGGASFVNAVLQSLARNPQGDFPAFEADPASHLSTWGSHPRWLVERWIARYGADAARRLVESNNERPELYLNVLDATAPARLSDVGIETACVPHVPGSRRVLAGSLQAALAAAAVIVQDPAATLVAACADDGAGLVLDLAAAPGGKAVALAAVPAAGRYVAAADSSWSRISRLRENVHRLSLPVAIVVADGREPPFRPAALVLVDAPCTGTGTFRRHPDGRWRVRPEDLTSLASLQKELLDSAADAVAPGGLLAYGTCSLEPEENEEQVAAFLERRRDFVSEGVGRVDDRFVHNDGTLRVLPHVHGFDGAFCALLRRSRAR